MVLACSFFRSRSDATAARAVAAEPAHLRVLQA
jgi:hypothetical protein